MIIKVPISLGELLDKISILNIKASIIKNDKKRKLIHNENTLLKNALTEIMKNSLDTSIIITRKEIQNYLNRLEKVNKILWKIEDDIRNCERKNNFDQKFVKLARSVYITNDKRAELKNEINKKFDSNIVEIKSYTKY